MKKPKKRKKRSNLYSSGHTHKRALNELIAHLKKISKDPEWGAQHTKRRKK